MIGVSVTKKQFNTYSRIGNSLIKRKLTSGFQIEDYNPAQRGRVLVYGHDSPAHIRTIQKNVGGRTYPCTSLYKWNPSWEAGQNTVLLQKKSLASERGINLETRNVSRAKVYVRKKAVRKLSRHPLARSWQVPDVRIIGSQQRQSGFRSAWLVTKNIDRNSRLSTLVVKKKKLAGIRRVLKGEKVRRVQISNYHPSKNDAKNNSLWQFIDNSV